MSGAASNATSLNRRASIHSAARAAANTPANPTSTTTGAYPPRLFSTLQIDIDYVSITQPPISQPLPQLTNLDLNRDNDDTLKSVIEEEEEDNEEDLHRSRYPVQPPPILHSTRPYPATLPRQRASRPLSEQYCPPPPRSPASRPTHHLQPDDQFARVYQPTLQQSSPGPRSVVPLHSSRPGPGSRVPSIVHSVGHSAGHSSGHSSGHSVSGYHVQAAISQSEYLQSSHVQHDETPVLSSAGSQSDEDDFDEVHSPIDHLELIDYDDDDDDNEGHGGGENQIDAHNTNVKDSDINAQRASQDRAMETNVQGEGNGGHHPVPSSQPAQEPPEIETQETLKRERTRILERTVVSSYREIDFKDISNIQPLKRGGYGEIHTAEWSRLRVVLKRALPEQSEGIEQFDQELEILKRVHDYDFIVPFYGVTTDPKTKVKCMVMKHCTNGNLCAFLEKHHESLTWSERFRLAIEITKGLEFLHKSGFHHRDLHSGNILLDDKRTAMICDFGLSRSSNRDHTSDLAATVGVASFLAPERFPQKRPVYSASCDVYSLGVIFWHISSGRIPFAKRLREPMLLKELMEGLREEIVPGTPREYRDLIMKCWDVKPSRRLKIDFIIAILQTLMAKPSEPDHQIATGFFVTSDTTSAALPVPPELDARMASLERASNILNRMIFNIQDEMMKGTVKYIEDSRAYFRDQGTLMEPYSPSNPPKTPIYLCPLVGDISALRYYLSSSGQYYNPVNESSSQTGDTALHLACLFLESPMDTIKILVELGADINLENLQGYTPVMILVSSNTQYCYEALKFFVMRGARIPAYIRNPITPVNSAQLYALNIVNESRQKLGNYGTGSVESGLGAGVGSSYERQDRRQSRFRASLPNQNVYQERGGRKVERLFAQGRPLIHVVAAMQEDYRILDCLCEAGLDPAMSFAGETALVAAAAHLRIKNVEWLLNHDLEVSTEAGVQRAIKVVKVLHQHPYSNASSGISGTSSGGHVKSFSASSAGRLSENYHHMQGSTDSPDIRDLGKYSWAGMTYGDADRMSRDMVGPVLNLLEQWTGSRRIANRKEVATKLKVMYGSSMDPFLSSQSGSGPRASSISVGSTSSDSSGSSGHEGGRGHRQNMARGGLVHGARSLRKSQRHVIDQVLNEKSSMRFW